MLFPEVPHGTPIFSDLRKNMLRFYAEFFISLLYCSLNGKSGTNINDELTTFDITVASNPSAVIFTTITKKRFSITFSIPKPQEDIISVVLWYRPWTPEYCRPQNYKEVTSQAFQADTFSDTQVPSLPALVMLVSSSKVLTQVNNVSRTPDITATKTAVLTLFAHLFVSWPVTLLQHLLPKIFLDKGFTISPTIGALLPTAIAFFPTKRPTELQHLLRWKPVVVFLWT